MSSMEMHGKKIAVNLIWKFTERIGVQLTNLIIQMVLARIIIPEAFAAVAIIMVFVNIATIIVQSGLGSALIQKKEVSEEDYSTVFYINILLSVIMIVIMYSLSPSIADFYQMPELTSLLRWQSLIILTGAFNIVQQAVLSRELKFRKNFFATLIACVLSGIAGVISALAGLGAWAIVILNIANNAIYSLVLWIIVRWRPSLKFSIKSMRHLLGFGWKLLVANIIGAVYNNMSTAIIGKAYSKKTLAYYNRAETVGNSLMNGITGAITSVMLPVLSQKQDDLSELKKMLDKTFQINSFICVPLMFGLAAVSDNLITVLFTETWIAAAPFLSLLCIGYSLYPIHAANLQAMYAIGRSGLVLTLEIIKRVLGIVIIFISIPFGAYAVAGSSIVISLFSVIINGIPNKKLLNYALLEQIKSVGRYFILSGLMYGIVYCIGLLLPFSAIISLLIQVGAGMITYVVLCSITKPYAYAYCTQTIKSIKRKTRD